jgi:hypothetical protein
MRYLRRLWWQRHDQLCHNNHNICHRHCQRAMWPSGRQLRRQILRRQDGTLRCNKISRLHHDRQQWKHTEGRYLSHQLNLLMDGLRFRRHHRFGTLIHVRHHLHHPPQLQQFRRQSLTASQHNRQLLRLHRLHHLRHHPHRLQADYYHPSLKVSQPMQLRRTGRHLLLIGPIYCRKYRRAPS